jgi:opacity protein-like surface antigen
VAVGEPDKWHFQLGGGADLLAVNFNTLNRAYGLGGELGIGYSLDRHWSLWMSENYYNLDPVDNNFEYSLYRGENDFFETVFSARYTFGGDDFKPYLGIGAGYFYLYSDGDNPLNNVFSNNLYDYYSGYSYSGPMIQGTMGIQFPMADELSLFAELKGNLSFMSPVFYEYYYSSNPPPSTTTIDLLFDVGVVIDGPSAVNPESANPISGQSVPKHTVIDSWFVKTGGGLLLSEDESVPILMSSLAGGFDLSNRFSIFGGLQQYPGFWSVMANVQYTIPFNRYFSPYLIGGVGFSFVDNYDSAGYLGGQFGLGLEFRLSPKMSLCVESELFDPEFDTYEIHFIPMVTTGLKFDLWSRLAPKSDAEETPSMPPVPAELSLSSKRTEAASNDAQGYGFVELAWGFDTPAQNWQAAYTSGSGEVFGVGYEFNDGWVLQLDVENFYYSGTTYLGNVEDDEVLVLPTVRYLLNQKGIRPYVLAGVGVELEFSTFQDDYDYQFDGGSVIVANLDAAVGVGVEIPLADHTNWFVEGKYNFVFANGVIGQDVPVLTGVRLGL